MSTPPHSSATTAGRFDISTLLGASIPVVFVFLWSSGFIVAKFGLPNAPPLTFILLRFAGVLAVLVPLVFAIKAPWPSGKITHIAVAGIFMQAGYIACVWSAIKLGMPAGLSALIVGMQPILTALASPMLGEKVGGRQWLGLACGLGGVALVVAGKLNLAGITWHNLELCVMGLVSITFGTLYQKQFCPHFDLRTGTAIQCAASFMAVLPFAIVIEHVSPSFDTVQWTARLIASLLWAIFAVSIGAIFLWHSLLRTGAATKVTSLLYLTPPTTAVMAWLMFGEALSLTGMLGMLLAIVGVIFVVRRT